MTTPFRVACIQVNTQNNLDTNIHKACELIKQAAGQGAGFITLPENVAFMADNFQQLCDHSFEDGQHPALSAFKASAKEHNVWLLIGALAVKVVDSDKLANRSFLINNHGEVVDYYDKIHLYDVSVKNGETHNESARFIAGDRIICAKTPFANVGMTVCYDVRFPHLYRKLAQKGADIITVPSSFTYVTGKAHWHVLLRARAIETGCFIVAPAQTGSHPNNRRTFGHSLIISPWGEVLADGGEDVGVICADIDVSACSEYRESIPSVYLDRFV
jgi:predicted amidohydrolase